MGNSVSIPYVVTLAVVVATVYALFFRKKLSADETIVAKKSDMTNGQYGAPSCRRLTTQNERSQNWIRDSFAC